MIHHYPIFFYSGSRRNEIESDWEFIEKHLTFLSAENQRIASNQYERIYLEFFNKGLYRESRFYANAYLQEFTKENWEFVEQTTKGTSHHKFDEKLKQVRKAQRDARPKIFND